MRVLGYQYTPQGYRTRLYEENKSSVEPDDLIMSSAGIALGSSNYKVTTWEFQRKVINRVLDRFRHFGDWLRDQEDNPKMTPAMRYLIEDTIHFINTGVRPYPVHARVFAINHEKDLSPVPVFKGTRHTPKLITRLSVPAEDYMWYWLHHQDGFNDMLCIANIVFGDISKLVITK